MSVSFSDLPKDVIWMIFQFVIKDYMVKRRILDISYYEVSSMFKNCSDFTFDCLICRLSLINQTTLKLIQSKTVKTKIGWFFIEGALLK
jgi:hypothetical protein